MPRRIRRRQAQQPRVEPPTCTTSDSAPLILRSASGDEAVALDQLRPRVQALGPDRGEVSVSTDGGGTWEAPARAEARLRSAETWGRGWMTLAGVLQILQVLLPIGGRPDPWRHLWAGWTEPGIALWMVLSPLVGIVLLAAAGQGPRARLVALWLAGAGATLAFGALLVGSVPQDVPTVLHQAMLSGTWCLPALGAIAGLLWSPPGVWTVGKRILAGAALVVAAVAGLQLWDGLHAVALVGGRRGPELGVIALALACYVAAVLVVWRLALTPHLPSRVRWVLGSLGLLAIASAGVASGRWWGWDDDELLTALQLAPALGVGVPAPLLVWAAAGGRIGRAVLAGGRAAWGVAVVLPLLALAVALALVIRQEPLAVILAVVVLLRVSWLLLTPVLFTCLAVRLQDRRPQAAAGVAALRPLVVPVAVFVMVLQLPLSLLVSELDLPRARWTVWLTGVPATLGCTLLLVARRRLSPKVLLGIVCAAIALLVVVALPAGSWQRVLVTVPAKLQALVVGLLLALAVGPPLPRRSALVVTVPTVLVFAGALYHLVAGFDWWTTWRGLRLLVPPLQVLWPLLTLLGLLRRGWPLALRLGVATGVLLAAAGADPMGQPQWPLLGWQTLLLGLAVGLVLVTTPASTTPASVDDGAPAQADPQPAAVQA